MSVVSSLQRRRTRARYRAAGGVLLGLAALALAALALAAPEARGAADRAPSWVRTLPHPFMVNESVVDVAMNGSGGTYCTGRAYRAFPGSADAVIARYDARGRRLWLRYWADTSPDSWDSGESIAVDARGNVYVLAEYERVATGRNMALLKYTARGGLTWVRRWASPGLADDLPASLLVDSTGTAYVTGTSTVAGVSHEIVVLKYSAAGRRLWDSRLSVPGTEGYVTSLALDGDGGLYGTGAVNMPGAGLDGFTARYSTRTGRITWSQTAGGSAGADDRLREVVVHGAYVYAAGAVDSGAMGTDGLVVRYLRGNGAPSGDLVWDDGVGGANSFGGIASDDHGRYYVASGGTAPMAGSPALFTLRISNSLGLVWSRLVLIPAAVAVFVSDVDLAGSGRAAVAGYAQSAVGLETFLAEYRATGDLGWYSYLSGAPALVAGHLAASRDGSVSVGGMQGDFVDCRGYVAHYAP